MPYIFRAMEVVDIDNFACLVPLHVPTIYSIFNENEKPGELEEIAKILSLQAEGENLDSTSLQTELKITSIVSQNITSSQDKSNEPQNFCIRKTQIDYRKMGNPLVKLPSPRNIPSPSQPSVSTTPDITRAMESSKAKNGSKTAQIWLWENHWRK